MEIGDVTREMAKQMNDLIKQKLILLERKVYELRDIDLAYLLQELRNENNIEKVIDELKRFGYTLEIDIPKPTYDIKMDNIYTMKAVMKVDDVKIRLKKLIAEV